MERILKYIGLGYAVVARYIFKNIKIKEGVTIPYLSLARTKSIDFVGGLDNGRILYAGGCIAVLTEIDLEIVSNQYTWESVRVESAMLSKKDYLPKPYRDVIKKYYNLKTILKGAVSDEDKYLYQKSKERLNAVFGMSCQDPLHSEILYDDGEYNRKDLNEFPDEAEKSLQKAHFPYQWGVYVTAYARKALQDAIDIADDKMVYCDTDSVKVAGEIDLKALNAKREKLAIKNGAVAEDRKGIPHYMGVFEYEGCYDRFVTLGAKRYCYEQDGQLHITVAGVVTTKNPETGIPYAVEELGSIENFTEGFIWKHSAGSMSVYNDNDNFSLPATDGSGKTVFISPNVAIIPTTYKMTLGREYKTLLQDIETYGEYIDRRR